MKWGYYELHFKDAFQRYLGKGLPSEAPPEPVEDESEECSEHPFSPKHDVSSASSAGETTSSDKSNPYAAADDDADVDARSASGDAKARATDEARISSPHPQHTSAAGQDADKSDKNASDADDADQRELHREKDKKEEERNVTRFPRGPVGRKARKG
jgi:hypothetical protein